MANKKVSQLTSKPSVLTTDLFPIADPSTGQLFKTTISDLGTAIGSGVSSVNSLVGAVVLDTDDIQELVSPTNKWFTDTRARAALSASSPLTYNSGTGAFGIQVANGSQNGYLSSADWNTFNNKMPAITFNSPLFIASGGDVSITLATTSANGYLSSTDWNTFNNKANDSLVVHLAGAETITGLKTFSGGLIANVTSGGNQGFASTNSSTSSTSVFVQNNSTGIGILANNASTGDAILIGNDTSGRGIYITNATISGSGKGISIDNYNSGIGIEVGSDSSEDAIKVLHLAGRGLNIQSSGDGYGLIINNTTASTSAPFTIQKQGVTKVSFTDAGAATFTGALSGTSATFTSQVNIFNSSALRLARFGTESSYYGDVAYTAGGLVLTSVEGYIKIGKGAASSPTTYLSIIDGGAATFSSSVTASTTGASDGFNTGAFIARGTGSTLKYTQLGYDTTGNFGWIQAVEQGTAYRNLILNPAGGNVGIGTTSPNGKLQIETTSGSTLLRLSATAVNTKYLYTLTGGADDAFTLSRDHPTGGGLDIMTWTYSGRVGIGTTAPAGKLSLYDTSDVWINISRSSSYVNIGVDSTGTFYNTNSNHRWLYNSGSNEAMRITSGGNVGIGTTSPSVFSGYTNLAIGGSNKGILTLKNASGSDVLFLYNTTDSNVQLQSIIEGLNFSVPTGKSFNFSGGNVGIGTTTPFSQGSGATTMELAGNTYGQFFVSANSASIRGVVMARASTLNDVYIASITNSPLLFGTNDTERMRLTTAGEFFVGSGNLQPGAGNATTGTCLGPSGYIIGQRNAAAVGYFGRGTNDGELLVFYRGTTQVGSISVTTVMTSYNVTSDYRLKEDLKPINGLDIVNKIKVYDYKWKADNSRMDGVLAHELQEVLPYAVTGVKDGEQMQSVDYSKIVPVMVQAIKELKAEVDTLKNK